jgi:hypothetical protein
MQGAEGCARLPACIPSSLYQSQIQALENDSCGTFGRTMMDAGRGLGLGVGRNMELSGTPDLCMWLTASCTSGHMESRTVTSTTSARTPLASTLNTSHHLRQASHIIEVLPRTTARGGTSSLRRTRQPILGVSVNADSAVEMRVDATSKRTVSECLHAVVSAECEWSMTPAHVRSAEKLSRPGGLTNGTAQSAVGTGLTAAVGIKSRRAR